VGRIDEERDLQRDNADLVEVTLADLTDAIGVTDPPIDARVSRWGGGLPQYAVGHLGRVQRVRAAVATQPGLAVCGATYDGVGIPACVASAERAAVGVLRQWPRDDLRPQR
jgi:oxygen-dependent protoporphyrinogen oxidase